MSESFLSASFYPAGNEENIGGQDETFPPQRGRAIHFDNSMPIKTITNSPPTFFERTQVERLPNWKDGLDKYPHAPLGRVDASDDAEPESLLPGPLLELHCGDVH